MPTITTSIERDAVNVRIGRQLIEKNNQNLDEIYSFQAIKSSIRRHLFSRGIWSPGYIRPSLLYVVGGHFERMVAVFCPYTVPSLASPYPANTPLPLQRSDQSRRLSQNMEACQIFVQTKDYSFVVYEVYLK